MKMLNNKSLRRRGADAYMDVGDTIPWMESVESSLEQRPRAMHGAIAKARSFFGFYKFLIGANSFALGVTHKDGDANKFAPTLMTLPTINSFSQRLRASARESL